MDAAAEIGRNLVSIIGTFNQSDSTRVWRMMSGLTQDGTAEPVLRDQIFRRERGQGNIRLSRSADNHHEQQQEN